MNLHVGLRVVCVNDDFGPSLYLSVMPRRGSVYVVTAIELFLKGTCFQEDVLSIDLTAVELAEFPSGFWFDDWHFRPLDERRIDQFRAHLAPVDRHLVPA